MSQAKLNTDNHKSHVLKKSAEVEVAGLFLERSTGWAIFARACISNHDGDTQGATAKLVLDGHTIDAVTINIGGESTWPYYLQAVVGGGELAQPLPDRRIQLICNTYDGHAVHASMIAMSADAAFQT
jgi:hypothetical protein